MSGKRSISRLPVSPAFNLSGTPVILFGKNVPRITQSKIQKFNNSKPLIKKIKLPVKK